MLQLLPSLADPRERPRHDRSHCVKKNLDQTQPTSNSVAPSVVRVTPSCERYRNEVMREDAHEERSDVGPRHALMQTYVDDPTQDKPAASNRNHGTVSPEANGLPPVE